MKRGRRAEQKKWLAGIKQRGIYAFENNTSPSSFQKASSTNGGALNSLELFVRVLMNPTVSFLTCNAGRSVHWRVS